MCSLTILEGNQKGIKYIGTLSKYLSPFAAKMANISWLYQQDSVSIQKAKGTRHWSIKFNLDVMEWPAGSPDLNPIENISGISARRLYAYSRQFVTVGELTSSILEEWSTLEPTLLYKLVHGMGKRFRQVLQRQGQKTDY